jgi:zinc/manganese transport system substrate-binding protein
LLAGCGGGRPVRGVLHVVASTNVYGNIAQQIGGPDVVVASVLSDPNADPHLFEPGTRVGLEVAQANVVVQNGVGYDAFMQRLEAASPAHSRTVVTIADALGVHGADANPHLWYDVPRLPTLAAAIERGLATADPGHAPAYRLRLNRFDASLAPLRQAVAAIARQFAGIPVAYTEPVPGYLLTAADLRNIAPSAFTRAIEDGTEPAPAAVAAMTHLMTDRKVRVLLYNDQTVSPITSRVRSAAQAAGVPVIGVSETLPAHTTFQAWQVAQVEALRAALAR